MRQYFLFFFFWSKHLLWSWVLPHKKLILRSEQVTSFFFFFFRAMLIFLSFHTANECINQSCVKCVKQTSHHNTMSHFNNIPVLQIHTLEQCNEIHVTDVVNCFDTSITNISVVYLSHLSVWRLDHWMSTLLLFIREKSLRGPVKCSQGQEVVSCTS